MQHIVGLTAFDNSSTLRLENTEISRIKFGHAVIASSSRPTLLPGIVDSPSDRIISSKETHLLEEIPPDLVDYRRQLPRSGNRQIYGSFGSRIHLVERQWFSIENPHPTTKF